LLTVLNVSRSHRLYGKTASAVQTNLFVLAAELHARDILLKRNGDMLKLKTMTGYGLDDREVGVRVPVKSRICSSPRRPDRLWGPPSLLSNWVPGVLSPGVKRQGRDADHSPPTSADVKKTWIYTSTPPYAFMA
jgi:hypothetical protein